MSLMLTRFCALRGPMLAFALFACVPACGAEPNDSAAPPAPVVVEETFTELSAEVGPAGGVLQGAPNGAFAGVRIEIPEGALSETTRIRISLAPAVPVLPELAQGVGPAYTIEPAGLKLAVPARVTLPVDSLARDSFHSAAADCKVWSYEDEAWKKLEAVGHDENSVTVESARMDLVLAGVVLQPGKAGPACDVVGGPACLQLSCNTPGKFCLEQVAGLIPKQQVVVQDKFVYLQEADRDLVRYDLDTQQNVVAVRPSSSALFCTGLPTESVNPFANTLVGTADGVVWNGTCRFTFDGAAATRPNLGNTGVVQPPVGQGSLVSSGLILNGASELASILVTFGTTPAPTQVFRFLSEGTLAAPAVAIGNLSGGGRIGSPPANPTRYVADPLAPTGFLTVTRQTDGLDIFAAVAADGTVTAEAALSTQLCQTRPVLAAHEDQVLALKCGGSGTGDVLTRFTRAGAKLSAPVSLPMPVELKTATERKVLQTVVDDTGGVWAVKLESETPNRLVYFAPGSTTPQLVPINGDVRLVERASEGRVVVVVLPTGKTERSIFTLRKVL